MQSYPMITKQDIIAILSTKDLMTEISSSFFFTLDHSAPTKYSEYNKLQHNLIAIKYTTLVHTIPTVSNLQYTEFKNLINFHPLALLQINMYWQLSNSKLQDFHLILKSHVQTADYTGQANKLCNNST